MMKKLFLSVLFFLLLPVFLRSESTLDSLNAMLQDAKKGSREEVEALCQLGSYFIKQTSFDAAFDNYMRALDTAEKIQYYDLIPSIYNGLGTVWRKRSDNDKALEHYLQAVKWGIEVDDERGNTKRLLNIGKIYYYEGGFNKALEYYQKAADNSEVFHDELGNAHAYKEMGSVYKAWQQYPKAKEYYEKALHIYDTLGEDKRSANVLNELGSVYRHEKDFQKAIEYQKKSLKIKEEIGYKYGIASSLNSLGISYKQLKDYDRALEYYQRALEIQQNISDEMGVAATISNIGVVYLKMGKHKKALQNFWESNTLAHKIGYNQLIINNLQAISDVYSGQKNYEQSLDYLSRSVALKDSIFNEEKHKQFAEMQTKYETEKKERENESLRYDLELKRLEIERQKIQRNFLAMIAGIILISAIIIYIQLRAKNRAFLALKKANEMISNQKTELERLNKTRDRFFSIISHDLRNSLVTTKMGVELLDNIEDLDKEEMFVVVHEIKSSVEIVSKLLENLLEWARIQIGRIWVEPEDFSLSEVLDDVLLTVRAKLEQKYITLTSKLDSTLIINADRNMVFSVLQNLITNAIKFTNENGLIKISQEKANQDLMIVISDNGIGMSSDRLSRLFKVDEIVSTPGTNEEKGTGLGLILCKEFIEKNGGSITVESKDLKGTTVSFTLPLKKSNSARTIGRI
ncbi:MAG: tetratricopeptide repeat-containing sensor histidine kinase [Candidatus Cloacimonetes bacterium]|nr:tetratricopeptide repeat-containing sensor histidine kinase [Candidatus Cloacimonadota bacterium]